MGQVGTGQKLTWQQMNSRLPESEQHAWCWWHLLNIFVRTFSKGIYVAETGGLF